jgi:hypothetical protein
MDQSIKNIFPILEVTKQSAKAGSFERKAWIRANEMGALEKKRNHQELVSESSLCC